MDRLTRDLLEVSTLGAGRTLAVDPAPADLASLLDEVAQDFGAQAAAAHKRVEARADAGLPSVLADLERVRQVLGNLVGNALKFVPPGGRVTLSAVREGEVVRCAVVDDGPGMPADAVAHVFDPFWQAAATRRLGCGLGLKIAKAIVEAHGGRIWAESREGCGSTFSFTLPVARAGSPANG
jgi:signal transduction histidine kinase